MAMEQLVNRTHGNPAEIGYSITICGILSLVAMVRKPRQW